ncbi:MAG: hypothetical protein DHS80DRAFT_23173 [Piptocephalis tieghemiana]|nr:MAG: hypothetical protein DHS80DRAFT_23173 [Piptocephalis tieghemiana]
MSNFAPSQPQPQPQMHDPNFPPSSSPQVPSPPPGTVPAPGPETYRMIQGTPPAPMAPMDPSIPPQYAAQIAALPTSQFAATLPPCPVDGYRHDIRFHYTNASLCRAIFCCAGLCFPFQKEAVCKKCQGRFGKVY